MSALNVGFALRKMAATASPTTELTVDGDNLSIKTQTTFKTTVINFKLGEEFEEETADGRKVKSTITKEGNNKLIHKQVGDKKNTTLVREFTNDKMTMTLTVDDIVCTRIYKKL